MSDAMARWQPWQMEPLGSGDVAEDEAHAAQRERLRRRAFEQRLELERQRNEALAEARQLGHAEGREQGYAAGLEEGRAAAAEELREQVRQTLEPLRTLYQSFDAALHEVDGLLAGQVGRVALDLAARLVGEALAVQPAQVEVLVRQMLASEPHLGGKPRLSLNPDDLPWVESSLGEDLEAAGWSLRADPAILPGGCRVTSATGELDATRQTREAMFNDAGQWRLDTP